MKKLTYKINIRNENFLLVYIFTKIKYKTKTWDR